jgi:hypothetical protein
MKWKGIRLMESRTPQQLASSSLMAPTHLSATTPTTAVMVPSSTTSTASISTQTVQLWTSRPILLLRLVLVGVLRQLQRWWKPVLRQQRPVLLRVLKLVHQPRVGLAGLGQRLVQAVRHRRRRVLAGRWKIRRGFWLQCLD